MSRKMQCISQFQSRSRCPLEIIISRLFASRLSDLGACKVSGPIINRSNDCPKVNPNLLYLQPVKLLVFYLPLRSPAFHMTSCHILLPAFSQTPKNAVLASFTSRFRPNRSFYQDVGQDTKDECNKFSPYSASHAEGGCSFCRNDTASTKLKETLYSP
jgi:hypothetical protein